MQPLTHRNTHHLLCLCSQKLLLVITEKLLECFWNTEPLKLNSTNYQWRNLTLLQRTIELRYHISCISITLENVQMQIVNKNTSNGNTPYSSHIQKERNIEKNIFMFTWACLSSDSLKEYFANLQWNHPYSHLQVTLPYFCASQNYRGSIHHHHIS